MFKGGTKVETHGAEVVPSFTPGIVGDNEGATWSDGMREKIIWFTVYTIVGRDSR